MYAYLFSIRIASPTSWHTVSLLSLMLLHCLGLHARTHPLKRLGSCTPAALAAFPSPEAGFPGPHTAFTLVRMRLLQNLHRQELGGMRLLSSRTRSSTTDHAACSFFIATVISCYARSDAHTRQLSQQPDNVQMRF
ncbi:hypothetical protein C2E23DRAFT_851347 [Lenzites betulinus]|nr:hypothetical protein C2E23DRAFT_851347 [Lenzites betulinus]